MICPRCGRLLKLCVTVWDEYEDYRILSRERYYCPCCGLTVEVSK